IYLVGPSFSGSLMSLRDLTERTSGLSYFAVSGQVTSSGDLQWFSAAVTGRRVTLCATVHSDTYALLRFGKYLGYGDKTSDKVALLTEDETAYGAGFDNGDKSVSAGKDSPIGIRYP